MEKTAISYGKLWALLKNRNLKKKDLQGMTHLSSAVIAKLGKNESVQMETLVKICRALRVNLSDILEFTL
ncbi:MAG: helix-turn-helix transcriptional regulator [Clostridia bacterium]|nr:helix-turn-helix transcriptional regulator [Clostridia bacterium]